jgi:glycosyltransferase involved in cell wall biosynthesis
VPDARLAVVGAGPEHDRLVALAASLGVAEVVEFVGWVTPDELVDWYRRAWVVATASRREGYGLTLLEAAACGTPGVASRIPGHVDAVVEGVTGLLGEDEGDLADALVQVLTDAELRARLQAGALEHAAHYGWDRTAAGILDALCEDADRRR